MKRIDWGILSVKINTAVVAMAMAVVALLLAGSAMANGVDWSKQTIRSEGVGFAPPGASNAAHARMLARRAALADAYRQLAEQIKGVQVDANTTVDNLMVKNDEVRISVTAFIQGAMIVNENARNDGSYSVTVEAPIFGISSLAGSVIPRPAYKEAYPSLDALYSPAETVRDNTGTSAAPAPAGKAVGTYTGLIIDCRGLGLKPAMSPVIKNEYGVSIYGYKNLDYDMVIERGMADYAKEINKASRAGNNPLIVKAVKLDAGVNPVLNAEDARRVLIENGATGFLDTAKVVFIR